MPPRAGPTCAQQRVKTRRPEQGITATSARDCFGRPSAAQAEAYSGHVVVRCKGWPFMGVQAPEPLMVDVRMGEFSQQPLALPVLRIAGRLQKPASSRGIHDAGELSLQSIGTRPRR